MVPAVVASPLTLASLLLVPVAAGCLSSDSSDTVSCTTNYSYGLSVTVDNGASNDECDPLAAVTRPAGTAL